jgi:hypothetical protein
LPGGCTSPRGRCAHPRVAALCMHLRRHWERGDPCTRTHTFGRSGEVGVSLAGVQTERTKLNTPRSMCTTYYLVCDLTYSDTINSQLLRSKEWGRSKNKSGRDLLVKSDSEWVPGYVLLIRMCCSRQTQLVINLD